jgi:hypothetical protein
VSWWDHRGSWKSRLLKDLLQWNLTEERQEEEEAPKLGLELPGGEVQTAHIRYRGNLGPCTGGPFLIASSGQAGKPFLFEDRGDGRWSQRMAFILQDLADVIDGEVLFAKANDLVTEVVLLAGTLRAFGGRHKETPMGILAKLVAQDAKTTGSVAKPSSRFSRREAFDEVGSKGLILPVRGIGGFEEDLGEICYLFSFTYRHSSTMSDMDDTVKRKKDYETNF